MLISRKSLIAYIRLWLTVAFVAFELATVAISLIYHVPVLVLSTGVFAVYLFLMIWYTKSYVNRYDIIIDNLKIIVSAGKMFRRQSVIDIKSVVYYERRVGVVSRIFGLCLLRLHLINRTVTLFGLTAKSAEELEAILG